MYRPWKEPQWLKWSNIVFSVAGYIAILFISFKGRWPF